MGGINRHPSCTKTWNLTTRCSRSISGAFAATMMANVCLENVLLAEFAGGKASRDLERMGDSLRETRVHLTEARSFLVRSIHVGQVQVSPYLATLKSFDPATLAVEWENHLVTNARDEIVRIATEAKSDHLAPAIRFTTSLASLATLTEDFTRIFEEARRYAERGALKSALEENLIPLQASFARLLSFWLQFMKEYLVDSLIATEAVFRANARRTLAAS